MKLITYIHLVLRSIIALIAYAFMKGIGTILYLRFIGHVQRNTFDRACR